MRTSVERLRLGLLVGAVLLVLLIAGFLGYARFRLHRAIVELPKRLGATITKEFNGYTYSQSDGKRTIFTIHASKAVQHTDGTLTLHDVNMVLYGKAGDRADRITGDDFEYDTKAEIIRASGVVHIDLDAPAPQGEGSSEARKHLQSVSPSGSDQHEPNSRIIHVKTSGLVYQKKLGLASTDQPMEFAFGGFTGHAIGAEYSADKGHLVLQSAITVTGSDKGRPVAMNASHGELDRVGNIAAFDNARYTSAGDAAQAQFARLHMRPDGSLERIEAERQVELQDSQQSKVTSDRANVSLNATSKPILADLHGNVHFSDDQPMRQSNGQSIDAHLDFDAQGHIDHAVLRGSVRTTERQPSGGTGKAAFAERDLQADSLDLALLATDGSKPQLRDLKASGSARMTTIDPPTQKASASTTRLAADVLTAHFIPGKTAAELSTVHGTGHTSFEQSNAAGVDEKSSGDLLDARLHEKPGSPGAVELLSAVQQGSVIIDRHAPAKSPGTAPEVQHATAKTGSYDAAAERFTLTGDVQMNDLSSSLHAERVVMERETGDAAADGDVKVSYLQSNSAEPVHVLAVRAELNHDAARATFFGSPAGSPSKGLARLWQPGANGQGGSQIEAPVLIFEQDQKRLTAKSGVAGAQGTVHAAFPTASPASSTAPKKDAAGKPPALHGIARITSSSMVYSDADRKAVFTGGVRVLDGPGEMRSADATVYLVPAIPTGQPAAVRSPAASSATNLGGLTGGRIDRIVATQHVELTQPGRSATGERLVYTASDQMFVLTGTASAPPRVVDAVQGSATGASLRFHTGDNEVVISGGDGGPPGGKVHTETRVKQ